MGLKYVMKNLSYFLIIFCLACQSPNDEVCCDIPREVVIGEPFSITQGENIGVENSIIKITFVQLVNDSLCPEDVECVTMGTLRISIDINGTEKTLSIGDNASPTVDYKDYTIELQELVYPTKQSEKDNSNSTYAVQMLITKS